MLVLEGDLPNDCIVGRDLIYRVPRMREASQNLRAVVQTCSEELITNLDEIRSKEFSLHPSLILVGFSGSFDLSRRDKKEYAFKTCRSQKVRKWQSLATNTGTGMLNRENKRVG